jgi:hypothetical protein
MHEQAKQEENKQGKMIVTCWNEIYTVFGCNAAKLFLTRSPLIQNVVKM